MAYKNEKRLHAYIDKKDYMGIQTVLGGAIDINYKDEQGRTPLLHVAQIISEEGGYTFITGDDPIIKIFNHIVQSEGVDINAKDKDGNTVLHLLTNVSINNVDSVQGMVKMYVEYDFILKAVRYLVEKRKMNPVQKNNRGVLPLHNAARRFNIDIIDLLMNNDDDDDLVNEPDANGDTSLHYAIRRIDDFFKTLIERYNANAYSKNLKGNTILHEAVDYAVESFPPILEDYRLYTQIMPLVTRYKLRVDEENKYGESPITIAREKAGGYDVVEFLEEQLEKQKQTQKKRKRDPYPSARVPTLPPSSD